MSRRPPSPLAFFRRLQWLDGRPLLSTIEPYRQRIFTEALYSFNDDGTPRYNLVLCGRAKKNYKTTDLVLAALYRFLVWPSAHGTTSYILANDEDQAGDDLELAKKLVEVNPLLAAEVDVRAKELVRRDGRGVLQILPARDVIGAHGKTYAVAGFDEIHGYRTWDLFEALAPDPTRPDTLQWITSYASIYNSPGVPLYDLFEAGRAGSDPRMFFSWYAADYTTDLDVPADASGEVRANPSLASWADAGYLEQQRRRLPTAKFARLHLNLRGSPTGAVYDQAAVMAAIPAGRHRLPPDPRHSYMAFVDMSGGSSDDATLGIAHDEDGRAVLDLVVNQGAPPPFNPRVAVRKFAGLCKQYGVHRVTGDRFGGDTFKHDFQAEGLGYQVSAATKHDLYEALEPRLNAREVELLDVPKLQEQMLTLVWRGTKIDHQAGDHDDFANAAAGAIALASGRRLETWDSSHLVLGPPPAAAHAGPHRAPAWASPTSWEDYDREFPISIRNQRTVEW